MTRAMKEGMDAPARVLRLPRVQARTGLIAEHDYVRAANGTFPQPVRLGARAVGWIRVGGGCVDPRTDRDEPWRRGVI